jgi:hypothetical protein
MCRHRVCQERFEQTVRSHGGNRLGHFRSGRHRDAGTQSGSDGRNHEVGEAGDDLQVSELHHEATVRE